MRERTHEQRRLLAQRNVSALAATIQGLLCFFRLLARIRHREELDLKAFKTVHMKALETTSTQPTNAESDPSAQPQAEATSTESSESLSSVVEHEGVEDAAIDLGSLHGTEIPDDHYRPLPPGCWTLPFHGDCPHCRHHHSGVEVRVTIAEDPSQVSHVRCERCQLKWAAFGGRNTTRLSLMSTASTYPDVDDRDDRENLGDVVQETVAAKVGLPLEPHDQDRKLTRAYTPADPDTLPRGPGRRNGEAYSNLDHVESRLSRSKQVLSWFTTRGRNNKNAKVKAH